ncbi:MAG: hypothetical protein NZ455_03735 [Bacteroidia bacterium]|nr:hypothetical protein [Bacteroidia bacterium]MDW8348332.1 hypothetical protein [Bacteroidia bacterium]
MFIKKTWIKLIVLISLLTLWACKKNTTPLRQDIIQNIKGKYCGQRAEMEIFADSTFVCTAKMISAGKTDKNVTCKGYYTLTYSEEMGNPLWTIKLFGKTANMGIGISCAASFVCWSRDKKYNTQEYKDVLFNEPLEKCSKQ